MVFQEVWKGGNMKNEQAKHDAWLRGEYEYSPEEVKEMQKY